MKKFTILLMVLCAAFCGMQVSAQPSKGPARSNVYDSKPTGYTQLGNTSIYYNISQRYASGPGNQYGISILGKIGNDYYSSTFEHEEEPSIWNWWNPDPAPGAGFIAAMKVNNNDAVYMNALSGTTNNGVTMTARLEPQGDVAARIVYKLTNNNSDEVTISAGVWGDIMIGTNDRAPIERLVAPVGGYTYGLKMKFSNANNAPLLCALFGEGVTGVTPPDDYWFGFFSSNWHANEIVGQYSNTIYNVVNSQGNTLTYSADSAQYYMVENGAYDSGLGFCWKDRIIPAGESIELSYVISVGEIDFEEPIEPDDPEEHFNYEVEVYKTDAWNDLDVAHPAHVWGYYEHPYGQNGYIEFMVDGERGTGEWTLIPGELVSGETFELPFDLYFNPDVTDIHTLQLRFTDGLGNYADMDGLEWEDVRSIDMTVNPETQYYDGTAKTFVVTIGGVIDYTLGENGEYTEPGDYDFSIYSDYDMNTIGINTVEFSVIKHQSVLDVVVPDNCVYDGEGHPATATLSEGDGTVIIIYMDTETEEVSTEAPVEPGTYEVFVEVTPGEFFDGMENKSYGEFLIDRRPCEYTLTLPEASIKYDGFTHGATVTVPEGSGVPTIKYLDLTNRASEPTTTPPSAVGRYAIILEIDDSGKYYYGLDEPTIVWQFEIYTEQTGVNELTIDNEDNGAWYTIDGRRVAAPTQSGIYIHNGNKYIIVK